MRVYGDYDVDGTNGAAMLSLFLREAGATVDAYVPDRLKEGYGLSRSGIERAHADGVTLLVTVDCGITAVEQVDVARALGIDVVICDHHEVGARIPDAVAVLDPIKPGDNYPFKGLCGCGVAFKLVQALAGKLEKAHLLPSYLEFVTLGTIADIVPLNDENRIMVRIGLETINSNPRPGVKALVQQAGFQTAKVSTGQVVFGLAPRINAVGRLGDAMRAVRLLLSQDDAEARELAKVLEDENRERRRIDEETFGQAITQFEQNPCFGEESAIVLHSGEWHPGVVGIVASRMVERYYKPSIMLATVDGVAKGSARSIPGFDIFNAMTQCADLLVQFGGHKYAAGLTIDLSRVDQFARRFKETVEATLPKEARVPFIRIDTELSLSDLTPRFVRILREFAPFGPGNHRPLFLTRGLQITGRPRIVGKNHLKFRVKQNGITYDAIGFGLGHFLREIEQNPDRTDLECAFSLEENEFGSPSGSATGDGVPQLKIKDLRFAGTAGPRSGGTPQ
jgi:single-stranded-DNA-specific exonuclease